MKLFSYVLRWDHGFAPNPFHGMCTLATCKGAIRKKANVGDWVLGTGSSERNRQAHAVFLMEVEQVSDFDKYWNDPRFACKRPVMNGSLKQRFGDNIYHRGENGSWIQADSRHSWEGAANDENVMTDTRNTDQILVGSNFIYWGDQSPQLPPALRHCAIQRPGWKEDFSEDSIENLVEWALSFGVKGQVGDPIE